MPEQQLKQKNTQRWNPPPYLNFCKAKARLVTFHNWPSTATQAPEKLSEGGFLYAGKIFKILVVTRNTDFHNRLIRNPSV
jgi:hypothetical protein